jgi:hypothetical protein
MKKYLNLWTDVNGLSRPFAEVKLKNSDLEKLVESPIDKSKYHGRILPKNYEKSDFFTFVNSLTPKKAVITYLNSFGEAFELAKELFPTHNHGDIFKRIYDAKLTFASKEVYNIKGGKYVNSKGIVVPGAACYNRERKELMISLGSLMDETLLSGIIKHEFGHYLHDSFHPKLYLGTDDVIREMVALFFEMNLGVSFWYGDSKMHFRAQKLLLGLVNYTEFADWNPHTQWNFIINRKKADDIEEYISEHGYLDVAIQSALDSLNEEEEEEERVVQFEDLNIFDYLKS